MTHIPSPPYHNLHCLFSLPLNNYIATQSSSKPITYNHITMDYQEIAQVFHYYQLIQLLLCSICKICLAPSTALSHLSQHLGQEDIQKHGYFQILSNLSITAVQECYKRIQVFHTSLFIIL
jgi:hypothetical protein